AGIAGPGYNRVGGNDRFVVAEIAIGKAVHQTIAEGIEFLGSPGLWNALSDIDAGSLKWRSSNGNRTGERPISRGRPVDVEFPEVERARCRIDVHDVVRGTSWGLGRSIGVGRQEAGVCHRQLKALEPRSVDAVQHVIAVPRTHLGTTERGAGARKHVPGH